MSGEGTADALAGLLREETGIEVRGIVVEAGPEVVSVRIGDAHLVELAASEVPSADPDPLELAEALHRALPSRLRDRLVEMERSRLARAVVDEAEALIRAGLEAEEGEEARDLSVDVIERPYRYRHGDPEEAQERGYPPFALEVRRWDPDDRVLVELRRVPPDPERLAGEALEALLSEGRDGG